MFSFKKPKGIDVYAAVKGTCKALNEVDDPMFAKKLMGNGIAIIPKEDIVYAPCDGVLSVVFPTGHAFGLTTKQGLEILIHIGIDTVKLNGKGFDLLVTQGQTVKRGTPLCKVDFACLKKEGVSTDVLLLVTNAKDEVVYEEIAKVSSSLTITDILFHCEKAE